MMRGDNFFMRGDDDDAFGFNKFVGSNHEGNADKKDEVVVVVAVVVLEFC